jgi:D-methionine transport system ATP-binding protein
MQVLDLLAQINADLGVTMVVITHSLAVAKRICNRIAVIDRGRIVEEGRTADVFANPQSGAARELIGWGFESADGDAQPSVSEQDSQDPDSKGGDR